MISLQDYLEKYKSVADDKAPKHWKADIVNQILELVGLNPKFAKLEPKEQYKKTFVYWLVLLKKSGKSWGDCIYVLKEASSLGTKYSKGGFITNQFKKQLYNGTKYPLKKDE